MLDALGSPIPNETRATCNECAMLPQPGRPGSVAGEAAVARGRSSRRHDATEVQHGLTLTPWRSKLPAMSVPPESPDRTPRDADDTFARSYEQMRLLARQHLQGEKREHTLQATALAHEAWLRLLERSDLQGADGQTFQQAVSQAMRRILIDHARSRGRLKRGGPWQRLPVDALELTASGNFDDLLAVDEAIEKLAAQDPRLAELVRLRFFSGLGVAETARTLGCAERTVVREWSYAKAWLLRYLRSGHE